MTFVSLSDRQSGGDFCGSAHKVESCHRKANGPGYQGSVSSTPCAQKGSMSSSSLALDWPVARPRMPQQPTYEEVLANHGIWCEEIPFRTPAYSAWLAKVRSGHKSAPTWPAFRDAWLAKQAQRGKVGAT